MKYQFYNQLPKDAKFIREEVFMKEQGFLNEFDDIDSRCLHLVIGDEKPIGCARMYEENDNMVLGRIAILKEYRHLHLGSYILQILEHKAKEMCYSKVILSAQVRVKPFYKKNGYQEDGDEYLDEFWPHVHMYKDI